MVTEVPGAINMDRYVDITSGVGGGSVVAQRQLIGRIFTDNNLLPPQSFTQFSSAADVGTYFGFTSNEYLRAVPYFAWVSKNITQAQLISYGRWVDSAVGSMIFGAPATYALSTFTSISAGSFKLGLGGYQQDVTGVNLSAAGSLAAVAAAIQTAIRAISAGGSAWTSATVSYDATRRCFDLVSGVTGADVITIALAGSGTNLAGPLGWLSINTILCNGSTVETITQCLDTSANLSDNFGSILFIPALNLSQNTELATWVDLQNVKYQACIPVTSSSFSALSSAIATIYAGTGMTLSPLSSEYPEMIPMIILAATNFDAVNGVQGYMFQENFQCTPSVTNDASADIYDSARVNYYGQTQSAGQFLQFYQRGILSGGTTSPVDMNVFANEQWLKSASTAAIMTLLLSLAQVPANNTGKSQLVAILQTVINQALNNGTISIGKPLTTTQKLFISQVTGDPLAWQQVQTIGYWFNVVLQSYTNTNTHLTEWKAVYTLVYSKDDLIRKVEGTDVLI